MKGNIPDDTMIVCSWCSTPHTANEWNDLTYSQCKSRDMRRAYTPITDSKAFSGNKKSYYKCPECGQWRAGSSLKIDYK